MSTIQTTRITSRPKCTHLITKCGHTPGRLKIIPCTEGLRVGDSGVTRQLWKSSNRHALSNISAGRRVCSFLSLQVSYTSAQSISERCTCEMGLQSIRCATTRCTTRSKLPITTQRTIRQLGITFTNTLITGSSLALGVWVIQFHRTHISLPPQPTTPNLCR